MTRENYEPVAARLDRWLKFMEGVGQASVRTFMMTEPGADVCVFRAELWRIEGSQEYDILIATGWAEEIRGQGNVNKTSHVENCETSAIGRALANAGFAGSDWTERPSREEMAKVERSSTPAETKTTVNKFAGKCKRCGHNVPAGGGIATTDGSGWRTYHNENECPSDDEEVF